MVAEKDNNRVLTLVDPLEGRDLWPGRTVLGEARTCVVGEEAVGVMEPRTNSEPGGRFLLLGLPDGRTIADVKLKSEADALTTSPCWRAASSISC